jgi:hypothetical protein
MALDFARAQDISQYLLDETGMAYRDGDFLRFARCFQLPQHVATFDGTRELRDLDDLRAMFDRMRVFFASKGVTHLERRCIRADFEGPDCVRAIHESRFMAGDQVVETAWPAYSILKCIDGVWKVSFSQYAVDRDHSSAMGTIDADGLRTSGDNA